MMTFSSLKIDSACNQRIRIAIPLVTSILTLSLAVPALAHHPFGGTTPSTWGQGFLSGVGHPVIGIDHLVFIIVTGLLATRVKLGWTVPAAFLATSLVGAGLHLIGLNLPASEFFISLSVVLIGILTAYSRKLTAGTAVLLSAATGVFHGYAYGEAIVGAEMTPLFSYLIGFTAAQGAIMAGAFWIARERSTSIKKLAWVRAAGLIACGAGGVFLAT